MARTSRKPKTGSVKVNFKDVESRQTPPEGDYKLRVLEVTNAPSKGSGDDMITFTLEIAEGKFKGQKLWFYCPLAENSLWKLHAFLTALGVDVPQDEMEIDLAELVDLEVVGVLTHETYQGKKRAKMTDFDSIENYKGTDDGDDDGADEPKSKKDKSKKKDKGDKEAGGKKNKKPKAEPVLKSEVEKFDRDELEELIALHKLDVDADDKKLKKDEKLLAAVLEDLEEKDLLTEEPKADKKKDKSKDKSDDKKVDKGKKDKKPAKKVKASKLAKMDEDGLQEVIDEHDLSVDIDGLKLKKALKAVTEALEEADLLDDDA